MPGTHALLSPSGAHRWLNCTASPRLEQQMPDRDTEYSLEGTYAHAVCAMKLKSRLGLSYENELKEIEALSRYHSAEVEECTDTYVDCVLERLQKATDSTKDALLFIENKLDFEKWIPEAYGTADAVIICDGRIEVIDFKYGKGVKVDADHNAQMMIYALGAYEKFSFEYDIIEVRMTIFQPRLGNISSWTIPTVELLDWAEKELKPKAREAFSGKGAQRCGDWCKFCKAKPICRELANTALSTSANHKDARLLSNHDIEDDVLPYLSTIKEWLSSVEAYVLERALGGTKYKGWKIVEGRSVRKIANQHGVINALHGLGYTDVELMKPEELRSLTDLEKLVGKKKFAEYCGEYIIKPQGKPTLVPESDKRPEYNSATTDFQNF